MFLYVKNIPKSPERKREKREENGGWAERGKHDDRARSYKGVVINGNDDRARSQAPQNKDRGGRDYYGKGKGKMVEGSEAKWVKTAERNNKKESTHHGKYRGDSEGSSYRSARSDEVRAGDQELRNRSSSGQTRAQHDQNGAREQAREEGEIKVPEEGSLIPPSQEFQLELARTQAEGSEVVSDPIDEGKGLQVVNGLLEEQEVFCRG